MVRPEGDLKGDKIELYLDETGRGLQRLEAYAKVIFLTVTPKGARAPRHGRAADVFRERGRYVMSGPLAHVTEQMPQECRENDGQNFDILHRSTDSITVRRQTTEVRTQT